VRVRLRPRGIRVGKARVLRLMREHRLLAPTRRRHARGDRTHSGTIITQRPDELWGTDATKFWTQQEGWCWFFGTIDHCAEDIVGWHVAKRGDRWAALEPIRQGVQQTHGGCAPKSPWAWVCEWIGGHSTRRISFSGSCAGSGSGRRRAASASPSATGS